MKFTAKKLVFLSLVEKATSIVMGAKNIAPVLTNLQIEVRVLGNKNRMRVISTDSDLSLLSVTEMVSIEEEGDAIIPARKFLDIIREAEDADITISIEDNVATIATPATKWNIQLMKENYPSIPETSSLTFSTVEAKPFVDAIKKVRLAVGDDVNRPELTLVKFSNDGIYATDGPRLHVADLKIPIEFELRKTAIDDLVRISRTSLDAKIGIAVSSTHIFFDVDNNIFMSSKLQVSFPDVSDYMNSCAQNLENLHVEKDKLLNAINRARITADEETNRINLQLSRHKLKVCTVDKFNNSCEEEMPVHWEYPDKIVSTNWLYLKESLAEMTEPNVVIKFGQDVGKRKAPIYIEEKGFFAIINQMRIS